MVLVSGLTVHPVGALTPSRTLLTARPLSVKVVVTVVDWPAASCCGAALNRLTLGAYALGSDTAATLYITVACAGTTALITPLVSVVVLAHRSCRV